MNLFGLPLHPLVVHATVVLLPLAALMVLAWCARADWRWWLRLPLAVVNALGLVLLFVTRMSGDSLAHATDDHKALIEAHDRWAGLLTIATVPMTLLTLLACWSVASTSLLPTGWGARAGRLLAVQPALRVLLAVLAVAVLLLVVMTGHSGAKAAWSA